MGTFPALYVCLYVSLYVCFRLANLPLQCLKSMTASSTNKSFAVGVPRFDLIDWLAMIYNSTSIMLSMHQIFFQIPIVIELE